MVDLRSAAQHMLAASERVFGPDGGVVSQIAAGDRVARDASQSNALAEFLESLAEHVRVARVMVGAMTDNVAAASRRPPAPGVTPGRAPRLDTWITATEAAETLGVSRQTVNKMINSGTFASLHWIGSGVKPMYLLDEAEIEQMAATHTFHGR